MHTLWEDPGKKLKPAQSRYLISSSRMTIVTALLFSWAINFTSYLHIMLMVYKFLYHLCLTLFCYLLEMISTKCARKTPGGGRKSSWLLVFALAPSCCDLGFAAPPSLTPAGPQIHGGLELWRVRETLTLPTLPRMPSRPLSHTSGDSQIIHRAINFLIHTPSWQLAHMGWKWRPIMAQQIGGRGCHSHYIPKPINL